MSNNNVEPSTKTTEAHSISCAVCGSPMYITDHGNHELTFHCSSEDARFWDFERGTFDQAKSKEHWDKSRHEIFQTLAEDVKHILNNEPRSSEK